MIKISNLSFGYKKKPVINDLNLELNQGETVLISGINGVGKTTLLRLMAGVLYPATGTIKYSPDLGNNPRESIGFISDQMKLYEDMTIEAAIHFHSSVYDIAKFDPQLIEQLKLDLNRRIKELSAGQKIILTLCLIMNTKPKIFLIDEVIHSIDTYLRGIFIHKLLHLIEDEDITLVMVNLNYHDIEKIPQRIILLKDGQVLVDESIEELKRKVRKLISREEIPQLPCLYSRKFADCYEYFVYPFEEKYAKLGDGQPVDLNLDEIIKAFIGGEYA